MSVKEKDHSQVEAEQGGMTRRDAVKTLLGASAALAAGVPGCERKPKRQIVSRALGLEYQQPARPLYYASTWTDGGYPYGLLIKTVDGRPVKVEGNPDHPANLGASTAAMQATTLSLYDPDRLRKPLIKGKAASWKDVDRQVSAALASADRVALVTRSTLGPSERALVARLAELRSGVQHFVHEAVHDGARRAVVQAMYGGQGELAPRLDSARLVLALDCDFLGAEGNTLEAIRGFASARKLDGSSPARATLPRLYAVDGVMTSTSGNADYRARLRPSAMGPLVNALRSALTGSGPALAGVAKKLGIPLDLLRALVKDLKANRGGQALVLAGGHLPASVHAGVALLNADLGAPGKTLAWCSNPPALPVSDPGRLSAFLKAGCDVAIFLGVNPAHDWPGGGLGKLLAGAKFSVAHALTLDETAAACAVALPSAHNLESWNDANPRAGVHSLCQPVIRPLFSGRQEADSLLAWTAALSPEGDPLKGVQDFHQFIKGRWTGQASGPLAPAMTDGLPLAARRGWERVLATGGVFKPQEETFPPLNREVAEKLAGAGTRSGGYEVVILPHHALHDGRFANNAWLQELPDPVSKLVWDNAAAISPATAKELKVNEGDLLLIAAGGRKVSAPALVEPGMADRVVAVTLGHGRASGGEVLKLAGGTNMATLLGADSAATPRLITSAEVSKAGGRLELVRTQKEFSMHDRPIVLEGLLDEYRKDPAFVKHKKHLPKPAEMYEDVDYSGKHHWAMSVDLNACVGCNACVTACQAENNIPVVGKEQCGKGREMHWMRIDRYLSGDPDNPDVHTQPMMCQQCDHAPCENVCPVNATSHSDEGLNDMTYNRCVGTRYCANNCPYKVRRFNYLRFQEERLKDPVQELVFNPQVTVRGVGVMEKCTFCVQRINAAKFAAQNAGEPLADGAIQTACQQACPAGAIQFGDGNDEQSKIFSVVKNPRAFKVLEELNVQPSVSYLARVRDREPGDKKPGGGKGGHG